jgi:CheY-like chemotaxis protein
MIADDSEIILEMITDFLEAQGWRVITTRSGLELLVRVDEDHPDIVLVDIQMPPMDGIETIRRLRAHHNPTIASVPIIAVTALAMSEDREKCMQAGANEYMSKPLVLKQLIEQIKEILKKQKKTT